MDTRANNGHDRRDERDEAEERTEPPLSLAWLPPDHRRAVREAIDVLLDGLLDDLADYPIGLAEVGETWLARWLPAAYLPRYDQRFARRFFLCAATVAWKLGQPDWPGLACVAEALALRAFLEEAAVTVVALGGTPDFAEFADRLTADADEELLFDPAFDGAEDSWIGARLGLTGLAFPDWFAPHGTTATAVHPYAADRPADENAD